MSNGQISQIKAPPQCEVMDEVRQGVDEVDRQLMELLALRFAYMDAAARIKNDKNAVRDEKRKAQVINNAIHLAHQYGLPAIALGGLWEELVEISIAHESQKWEDLRNS